MVAVRIRHLPTIIVVSLLLALLPALAGCGSAKDSSTPVACLEGTGAYIRALAAVPGEATLGGDTPISDCLAENQEGGDLATVGEAMVEAATRLNAEAREEPGGPASVRLGYLPGAADRGAERPEGTPPALMRRPPAPPRSPPHPPLPAAFLRAYREGFEAG